MRTVEIHLSEGPFSPRPEDYVDSVFRDELVRAQRFSHEGARSLFLEGRRLARTLLAERLAVDPTEIEFRMNSHGRPDLAESDFRFNLSHTDGLVVCAIVDAPVELGVDVERVDRNTDLVRVGKRSFSPTEYEAFLASNDRREAFFEIWTAKEAYIKARGVGVALGLDRFIADVLDLECDLDGVGDEADAWRFGRWSRGRYRIACAVREPDASFVLISDGDE